MQKRSFLKFAALAVLAGSIGLGSAQAQDVIKIGAVAPKTGPLAGGSAVTHWPNIKLWITQVNARGGLTLKSGKATLELIEYDDRTNPGETIKAVERLATQDKVDFILAPYGTGFNLAAAPIFAKYGYPLITSTAITDKSAELIARYDNIFFRVRHPPRDRVRGHARRGDEGSRRHRRSPRHRCPVDGRHRRRSL